MSRREEVVNLLQECSDAECDPVGWWLDPESLAELRNQDLALRDFVLSEHDPGQMLYLGIPVRMLVGSIEPGQRQCITLESRRQRNGRTCYFDHPENGEWAR